MLNKTLRFVRTEIFFTKLQRKCTKLYPMIKISSDHKIELKFSVIIYDVHCPWILKMIR